MSVMPLVYAPAVVLNNKGRKVEKFDSELQSLVNDMFDTMYHNAGCGLAAPQVGVSLALSVIDMSGKGADRIVLANPEIIDQRGEPGEDMREAGCLSIPGIFVKVKRYSWVKVRAQDASGKYFEVVGEGMLAECLQHEIDHLQGKLIIDYFSPLKYKMLMEKSKKVRKKLKLQ